MSTGISSAPAVTAPQSPAADHTMSRPAAVALKATVAIAAIYGFAVVMPWGQAIDTEIMITTARVLGEPAWAQTVLDLVARSTVLVAAAALAGSALLRGRPVQAACAFGVATVTPAAASVLKAWLDRPSYGVGDMLNSLPSGHVAAVAGLAAAAWFVTEPAWRASCAVAGAGAVTATGLATITLQWHRPSDVAAAIALAIAVAAVGAVVQERAATWGGSRTGVARCQRPGAVTRVSGSRGLRYGSATVAPSVTEASSRNASRSRS